MRSLGSMVLVFALATGGTTLAPAGTPGFGQLSFHRHYGNGVSYAAGVITKEIGKNIFGVARP